MNKTEAKSEFFKWINRPCTPDYWCKIKHLGMECAFGWRNGVITKVDNDRVIALDPKSWNTPISEDEFLDRLAVSVFSYNKII